MRPGMEWKPVDPKRLHRSRLRRFRGRGFEPTVRVRYSLRDLAYRFAQRAFAKQVIGDLVAAERLYLRSIDVHPTAEAHTFLGWLYALRDDFLAAIHECERAIEIDPDLGNPYNDIGTYLIELGRWDEAIPWLKKALRARRYDAPHYPYLNLGRVYEHRHEWEKAKWAFQMALTLAPDFTPAEIALRRMMSRFN